MELQYKKALEHYNLQVSKLPEDAKIGIEGINDVLKAIAMLEKRGKVVKPATLKKLKAMDKWVYYEILDFVQGTDNNDDKAPEDTSKIVDEIKNQANNSIDNDKKDKPEVKDDNSGKDISKGVQIEIELENLLKSGTSEIAFEDLKSKAKNTYNVLFDSYEENEQNGIKTTKYSIIETKKNIFTINKN